ncbi:MAG: hypothetical protein K9J81_02345 [Desulfohalobiaceae bacterium]|jgi:polyhydroxyalkanoate synthesis regulator phasin|nr:hypothetical protein [Desulfohalobiaceae bacterium]
MFELMKKTLLAGLGTAVITRTKVKEIMQKMVDQGKITSEEADRYTRELMENGEKELKEISEQISKSLGKLPSTFNLAEKDSLEALLSRVDNLEKRLDLVEDNLIKHVHEAQQTQETQSK